MSDIDVPYLPISKFDPSFCSKRFSDDKSDKSNDEKIDLKSLSRNDVSDEIPLILLGMGMEKYVEVFRKRRMALDSFLNISESELEVIGITDADDRKTIIKHLSVHQKDKSSLIVAENHIDDLNIIKNVHYELLLLQNYCAYLDLQLKKQTLTDYTVDSDSTACTFLKDFAECALTQSQMMSSRLYQENDFETIIKKILKMYDLTLPEELNNKLQNKINKKNRNFLKILGFIGCSSLVILTGKYLMKRNNVSFSNLMIWGQKLVRMEFCKTPSE